MQKTEIACFRRIRSLASIRASTRCETRPIFYCQIGRRTNRDARLRHFNACRLAQKNVRLSSPNRVQYDTDRAIACHQRGRHFLRRNSVTSRDNKQPIAVADNLESAFLAFSSRARFRAISRSRMRSIAAIFSSHVRDCACLRHAALTRATCCSKKAGSSVSTGIVIPMQPDINTPAACV